MEHYLGDLGILIAGTLMVLYMMWDKIFHEND